jgi:hypothetical protein
MTLKTLADVRALMRHLPVEHPKRPTRRHVAAQLEQAAADKFGRYWGTSGQCADIVNRSLMS